MVTGTVIAASMDRPLRLLGFGNGYPPEVIGGYPEGSADEMEGLTRSGPRVTSLVCQRQPRRGAAARCEMQATPGLELDARPFECGGSSSLLRSGLRGGNRGLGWGPRIACVVRGGFDFEPFRAAGAARAPAAPPRRVVFAGRIDW